MYRNKVMVMYYYHYSSPMDDLGTVKIHPNPTVQRSRLLRCWVGVVPKDSRGFFARAHRSRSLSERIRRRHAVETEHDRLFEGEVRIEKVEVWMKFLLRKRRKDETHQRYTMQVHCQPSLQTQIV